MHSVSFPPPPSCTPGHVRAQHRVPGGQGSGERGARMGDLLLSPPAPPSKQQHPLPQGVVCGSRGLSRAVEAGLCIPLQERKA